MVILGIFTTLLLGYLIINLIYPSKNEYLKLSLGYLAGLGFQSLIMFYLALLNIKLNLINVSIVILIFTLFLILLNLNFRKSGFWKSLIVSLSINNLKSKFININKLEQILVLVILGIYLYVIVISLYWPVTGWDSIALYDFRAKVFSVTGYMDEAIRRGYFFGYPLMTSMSHTWIYLLGFNYPKIIYSLMYISFSVVFYFSVREYKTKVFSLFSTLFVMTNYELFVNATFDYTNLPYTIFFFTGSVYLFKWYKSKNVSYLIISALFTGLATWIRSTDPFWVANIIVLIYCIIKDKSIKPILVYLVLFLPIQQSWSLYLSRMSPNVSVQNIVGNSIGVMLSGIDLKRFVEVLVFMIKNIGNQLVFYILIFLTTSTFNRKFVIKNYMYYVIVGINIAILISGTYVFSYLYPGWGSIAESLGRMVYIFIPLLIYGSVIAFDYIK